MKFSIRIDMAVVSTKPFKSENRGLLQLFKLIVKSLNDMIMIDDNTFLYFYVHYFFYSAALKKRETEGIYIVHKNIFIEY